jgi:hypothetical protein
LVIICFKDAGSVNIGVLRDGVSKIMDVGCAQILIRDAEEHVGYSIVR